MAPTYKLTYFDARGRAEPARLLFAQAGVNYEDIRITHEAWGNLKAKTPFGQIPMLEIDGKVLPQSKAICRYLAKQFKLTGKDDLEAAFCDAYVDTVEDVASNLKAWWMEKDAEKKKEIWNKFAEEHLKPFLVKLECILKENGSGYLVGKQLTWADLYVFELLNNIHAKHPELFTSHAKLTEFIKHIGGQPKIKTWIEKRPKTEN